jgi:peptide/nickel transport system permease protein
MVNSSRFSFAKILTDLIWLVVMALAIIFFSYLGLDVMTARDLSDAPIELWNLTVGAGEQTVEYVSMLFNGDLGTVVLVVREEQVLDILKTTVRNSLGLLAISLAVATLLGTWLGVMAALNRRGSEGAYGMLFFTMLGVSIPAFLVAILLQRGGILYTTTFGRQLVNMGGYGWDYKHMAMPVLVLMARPLAHIARLVYVSLTEILTKDYIRTARAKGLRERFVIVVHAGSNLATSLLTAVGVSLRYSLGILPLVEFIFAWPGLGLYALTAIRSRLPLLLIAIALVFALSIRLMEILIQSANRSIDPTLREQV